MGCDGGTFTHGGGGGCDGGTVTHRGGGGLGGEGGGDALGMGHLEGSIHLVGGDLVEALALVPLGEALPIGLGGLEQGEGAHHIGLSEGEGVLDAAVHVALGCQMDDAVHMFFLHQLQDALKVADVHLDKLVVGLVFNVLQVGQVTGIGELIQIDNPVLGVLIDEQPYDMAADETGSAGDEEGIVHYKVYSL